MSIFLAYHNPCLDGSYSAALAYLFFRDIQRSGLENKDFIEYISKFESFSEIDKSLYEFKGKHLKEDHDKEERKSQDPSENFLEYSLSQVKDVYYVAAKQDQGLDVSNFPFRLYEAKHIAESVLILMDYNTNESKKVEELCNSFSKVVIIDHHLTLEHILNNFSDPPKNLLYLYKKEKSGATLTLEFFEKIKGAPIMTDKGEYKRLKEILSYVEDHDLMAGKVKNSEEFVCGINSGFLRLNLNVIENNYLFRTLLKAQPDQLIKSGAEELHRRIQESKKVVAKKHLIYLGGKTIGNQGRFGVCYGAEVKFQELRNEVGTQLAQLSYAHRLENMGFVYSIQQRSGKVSVSLRSIKGLPGGDCETIARAFEGGGHFNSSGFALTSAEFKKWK